MSKTRRLVVGLAFSSVLLVLSPGAVEADEPPPQSSRTHKPAEGSPYKWKQMGIAALIVALTGGGLVYLVRRNAKR